MEFASLGTTILIFSSTDTSLYVYFYSICPKEGMFNGTECILSSMATNTIRYFVVSASYPGYDEGVVYATENKKKASGISFIIVELG